MDFVIINIYSGRKYDSKRLLNSSIHKIFLSSKIVRAHITEKDLLP